MNNIFLGLLLAVFSASAFAATTDPATRFEEANRLFAEKDYDEARNSYEQLVTDGTTNPAVFLNLGHAEYRLGRPALAAINYRRALALDPADTAARSSLEHVQRELGQPAAGMGFAEVVGKYISYDLLVLFGSLLFWVGLLLVVFAVFSTRKRTGLTALGVFIAVVGATAVAVSWAGDSRIALEHISVAVEETEARSTPADNGQKLSDLKKGAPVRVIASRDDWSLVRLPIGVDGWIKSTALQPVLPADHPPSP